MRDDGFVSIVTSTTYESLSRQCVPIELNGTLQNGGGCCWPASCRKQNCRALYPIIAVFARGHAFGSSCSLPRGDKTSRGQYRRESSIPDLCIIGDLHNGAIDILRV